MLAFATVVLIQAGVTGSITMSYIQVELEQRIGDQALQLSNIVSNLPQIRQGQAERNVDMVQFIAEQIRKNTDARFIVVGDRDGIRFSHPIPERIGKKRVGGDNARALENGESRAFIGTGSDWSTAGCWCDHSRISGLWCRQGPGQKRRQGQSLVLVHYVVWRLLKLLIMQHLRVLLSRC